MAHTYYETVDDALGDINGVPAPSSTGPTGTSNGYQDRWLDKTYMQRPALGQVNLYGITNPPGSVIGPMLPSSACFYFRFRADLENIVHRVYEIATFTSYDVFYNGALASPMDMHAFVSGETIYFTVPPYLAAPNPAGYPRMGVFLMSGMSIACNLVEPCTTTIDEKALMDRRLTIVPFDFEYQRVIRYLATVSGKRSLVYQFPRGMVPFSSRLQSATPDSTSDLVAQKHIVEYNDFPASLGFNDPIPIYDARESEAPFNEDFFASFRHLPKYSGDLPINSLVTVAFTASIWPLKLSCGRILDVADFHVQFVILHAL